MIHPAKNPMEGGFSLDKFMPSLAPEDAEALAKMFDDMEEAKESERKAGEDAFAALHLVSRIREALGDNGKRMQDELLAYCRELINALRTCRILIRGEMIEHAVVDITRPNFSLAEYLDGILPPTPTPFTGDPRESRQA